MSAQPTVHELTFGQKWTENPSPDLQPAFVRVWQHDGILEVEAHITDAFISDPPAAFNDFAYTKGDVFELFIKAEGDTEYHEIHVTPSNVLLQLRFSVGSTLPFDAAGARIWEPFVKSSTERVEGGWIGRFSIPLEKLTTVRPIPRLWTIGCGRYDYRANGKPIISNTAPITVASFHRYWEWPVYDLGE